MEVVERKITPVERGMKLILKNGFQLEIPKDFAQDLHKKIANGMTGKICYTDDNGELMCMIDLNEIALITTL